MWLSTYPPEVGRLRTVITTSVMITITVVIMARTALAVAAVKIKGPSTCNLHVSFLLHG